MNIFITSKCPIESAAYLDDKRVVKMILESAQLLSTAITVRGGAGPYRPTHQNHPCSVWVRETNQNYLWLYFHFIALNEEYTKRYGNLHKCLDYADQLFSGVKFIPAGPLTSFVNCTPYKDLDTFTAYIKTLDDKWQSDKRAPTWYNSCKIGG